ncbi:MAG: AzlC family ABC transporter permease [Acidimicrobiia bacterium]
MNPSFRRGLRDGAVLFVAIGAFGTAFGVLAVQAGLDRWLTVLASLIVISGAAQFTMAGLLASGAAPVLVATTGLALRHIPMSARLAELIGPRPLRTRIAMAWILVDETFGMALHVTERGEEDIVSYKAGTDMLLYSGWVGGTALGAMLGDSIDPERWGIDVFFPLVFLGLAAPLVRKARDWFVAGVAVASAIAATYVLPEAWQITGAATVAATAGAMLWRGPDA